MRIRSIAIAAAAVLVLAALGGAVAWRLQWQQGLAQAPVAVDGPAAAPGVLPSGSLQGLGLPAGWRYDETRQGLGSVAGAVPLSSDITASSGYLMIDELPIARITTVSGGQDAFGALRSLAYLATNAPNSAVSLAEKDNNHYTLAVLSRPSIRIGVWRLSTKAVVAEYHDSSEGYIRTFLSSLRIP